MFTLALKFVMFTIPTALASSRLYYIHSFPQNSTPRKYTQQATPQTSSVQNKPTPGVETGQIQAQLPTFIKKANVDYFLGDLP